jgi:hypothetical protein
MTIGWIKNELFYDISESRALMFRSEQCRHGSEFFDPSPALQIIILPCLYLFAFIRRCLTTEQESLYGHVLDLN